MALRLYQIQHCLNTDKKTFDRASLKTFQLGQGPPQGYGIKRRANISTVSPDSIGIED